VAPRRRGKRDKADKAIGLVLGLLGIVLVVALAMGSWWLRKTKIQIDADNCPRSGPKAVHVIMIDRSDPISGQQAQRVKQHTDGLKASADFGTRFDVYTFEGDVKNEMTPLLRVCAPGRPEQANELIENPDFVRRRYEENFSTVLDKEIEALLQESTRQTSPIIESLRAASISSFGPITVGTIPLRVTLVSDMVQHTKATSHFRTDPNFTELSKTAIWPSLRPDLKGADVEILYLLRPDAKRSSGPIQNRGHQLFWEQLIAASGGRVTAIDPI
jgi:hypothetical protein